MAVNCQPLELDLVSRDGEKGIGLEHVIDISAYKAESYLH